MDPVLEGKKCYKRHYWINQQSWNMDTTLKCCINVKYLMWKIEV